MSAAWMGDHGRGYPRLGFLDSTKERGSPPGSFLQALCNRGNPTHPSDLKLIGGNKALEKAS